MAFEDFQGAMFSTGWHTSPRKYNVFVETDVKVPMDDGVDLSCDVFRPDVVADVSVRQGRGWGQSSFSSRSSSSKSYRWGKWAHYVCGLGRAPESGLSGAGNNTSTVVQAIPFCHCYGDGEHHKQVDIYPDLHLLFSAHAQFIED